MSAAVWSGLAKWEVAKAVDDLLSRGYTNITVKQESSSRYTVEAT